MNRVLLVLLCLGLAAASAHAETISLTCVGHDPDSRYELVVDPETPAITLKDPTGGVRRFTNGTTVQTEGDVGTISSSSVAIGNVLFYGITNTHSVPKDGSPPVDGTFEMQVDPRTGVGQIGGTDVTCQAVAQAPS